MTDEPKRPGAEGAQEDRSKPEAAVIEKLIRDHVTFSMVAGAIPIPIVDIAAVTAIQMDMLRQMSRRYGVDFSEERGKSIAGSLAGATLGFMLGRAGASAVKVIPGIGTILGIGSQVVMAGASTYALGKVFQSHYEQDGTLFSFDVSRMQEKFRAFMERGRDLATGMQKQQSREDILETIEKLKKLKEDGTISETEFESAKKELLAKLTR